MLPSSFRFCIDRAGAERFRGVRAVTDTRKRRARGRTARRFPRESASFAIPYERLYYPPRNGNGELAYLTDANLLQTGIDSSWLSRVIRIAGGQQKPCAERVCTPSLSILVDEHDLTLLLDRLNADPEIASSCPMTRGWKT